MLIDLNADLGEGAGSDAELLEIITSANVNCGGHAADTETIRRTLKLIAASGTTLGAHPGHADPEHFGRRELPLTEAEVAALIRAQVGSLMELAAAAGLTIRYLKPHGGLYHQAMRDDAFAAPIARYAAERGLALVGLPGSRLAVAAAIHGAAFVAEGYLDRRYLPDGNLVPRTQSNAMIHAVDEATDQALMLVNTRGVRTLCVHGDSPGAVQLARAVRDRLTDHGCTIGAFA